MGILIPGSLFKESYLKRRLHPKNLSRALEDSATMLDGAIPWASGAVYMSGVLGVSAFEYVPWMVFNYSSVFIGLACAMLGIGIGRAFILRQVPYAQRSLLCRGKDLFRA